MVEKVLKHATLAEMEKLQAAVQTKNSKELELDLFERIVAKLLMLSEDCNVCKSHVMTIDEHIKYLQRKEGQITRQDLIIHQRLLKDILAHLQKEHKIVMEDYYLGLFLSIGLSMGFMIGLLFIKSIALGLPIGISLGIVMGVLQDGNAKKRGFTI